MNRRNNERDRRIEQRYPIGGRLTWNKPTSDRRRLGLLTDMSDSSVAFVTCEHRDVSVGDQVNLSTAAEEGFPHRVARIAAYGDAERLVVCQRME